MAYIIVADRNGELERRELTGPLLIGRAHDCDIVIKDILLSRRHCRIERFDNRWVISDLGSKNGTRVGQELITRHVLRDGEVIRVGRAQIAFMEGAFVPAPAESLKPRPRGPRSHRPADPNESLAGTVLGFQLFDMEEDARLSGHPIPRPRPAEPASYRDDAAHALVAQITSSTWDSILTGQTGESAATQDNREQAKTSPPTGQAHAPSTAPSGAPPAAAADESAHGASAVAVRAAPMPPRRPAATRPTVIRSVDPNRRATIPSWLAVAYVALAAAVAGGSLFIILRHGAM
ncbi:FHA domain-containing protein [Fontivita pretiosa]|uniref:FHA domain-containing protein n=1 Tax=Fontivita pretiosa TaxID=2989684 RepID=UPI003D17B270